MLNRSTKAMKRGQFKRADAARLRLRRSAMNKVGKQGRANKKANAKLAKDFIASGQDQTCELQFIGCFKTEFLSWCHSKKRRKLSAEELETSACLGCVPCHEQLERMQPEEMEAVVMHIIATRERAA